MSRPVIHYFPIRGRAEVLRLAIVAGGDDFDVVDVNYQEQKSDREKYPFGQCPRLVDGDLNIVQSNTIARHPTLPNTYVESVFNRFFYLARKYKLQGKDETEMVAVDEIMEGVESLRVKYVNLIYNDKLEEAAKDLYWKTYFDKTTSEGRNGGAHMVYLANFLAKNGGKHTVGAGLTIADLCLWEILDLHLRIFEDAIKKEYPELVVFHDHIASQPGIKEYLASPKRLAAPNANTLG